MIRASAVLALQVFMSLIALHANNYLSDRAVKRLAINVPSALKSRASGGCPEAEITETMKSIAYVQVANPCTKRSNGTIGNFRINRHNGRIYTDDDSETIIDSSHLRRLRRELLNGRE